MSIWARRTSASMIGGNVRCRYLLLAQAASAPCRNESSRSSIMVSSHKITPPSQLDHWNVKGMGCKVRPEGRFFALDPRF
jgi:hypothetical protein